jgi:hypothetical protein
MNKVKAEFDVTEADVKTARRMGASGAEVLEFTIHRTLDEDGVPRGGRYVKVTRETITIELPDGWEFKFD